MAMHADCKPLSVRVIERITSSYGLRLACGFAAAAICLAVMGLAAKYGVFETVDGSIRNQVISLESPPLTAAMLAVTRLGSTVYLWIIGAAVVIAFAAIRKWRLVGMILLAMIGQAVLHLGFKAIFDIERPPALLDYVVGDTPSFPSGHAIASTSFYGLLAVLAARHSRGSAFKIVIYTAAAVLIFAICFSRVYFGVHHPSDVAAGSLAAAIWIAAVATGDKSAVTE
jgi:undecaprenyl-diphosphatase